jgi:hypothetical protein
MDGPRMRAGRSPLAPKVRPTEPVEEVNRKLVEEFLGNRANRARRTIKLLDVISRSRPFARAWRRPPPQTECGWVRPSSEAPFGPGPRRSERLRPNSGSRRLQR